MIRSASEIAKSAVEAIGNKAAALSKPASGNTFAEVLSHESGTSSSTGETEPITSIREKLAKVVTETLNSIGVPLDPALTFIAGEDGNLHLETPHPQAAEIEANLRENSDVRLLASQLLGAPSLADRRLVLHSVSDAPR